MFDLNGRSPIGIHIKSSVSSISYANSVNFCFLFCLMDVGINAHHHFCKIFEIGQNPDFICVNGYFHL